jgi:hypothetical protein
MAEPDLYEGDEAVRRAVCDHAGHDWKEPASLGYPPTPDVETCGACGASRTSQGDKR